MPLVLAVHGSALPAAGATVGRLCDAVERRTGVRPVVGHLDHQLPSLGGALGAWGGWDAAGPVDAAGTADTVDTGDAAGEMGTSGAVDPADAMDPGSAMGTSGAMDPGSATGTGGAADPADAMDPRSATGTGTATDKTGVMDPAGAADPGSASHAGAVVVPLLLGDGFHCTVDIPAVVAAHGGPGWVLTPSLSGAFEVDAALAGRLARAEATRGGRVDAIVFATAGSSRPGGNGGALLAARRLAGRRPGTPVVTAYCSATGPTVPQALAGLRAAGHRRIGIVTHLLAPGRFTASLDAAGADLVTEPLADHPAVADLVVRRYREAAADAGRAARRIAHVAA
ncbi:sirohydrochlorin chelatase [Streptomyces sp. KL116D]|uniref:sirohydrochlorin chelatase n=1 Tax=Streptomyces sp. KL116D TaxID=3045152 RepID=UPI0035578E43